MSVSIVVGGRKSFSWRVRFGVVLSWLLVGKILGGRKKEKFD